MATIYKDGYVFKVPSKVKNKKYDVYKNGQYLTSFGDSRYQQYIDTIGFYARKNHYNVKRRNNYRKRHAGEEKVKESAGYFAFNYLW